ncbi:hypothetical protein RM190_00575 [Paracoccus sp. CPCC 101403]|uniref:Uncharacterized protein n=1 Tax=Paracoccus broussonetiae TaxID=3075834 RepID=A0ABU3E7Y8_9RHOB|nr:hypothetical protein [Paracoccus sp. CPCC 101403]MDT1060327.1 hypothetical protein [Paracoccus sp. CPCC 101403]
MIARKIPRPIARVGKARVAISAKMVVAFGRLANKAALDSLSVIGKLPPDAALARLKTLDAAAGELAEMITAAEDAASDLQGAADILEGKEAEGGAAATLTAVAAAGAMDFAKRLDPAGDFGAVVDTVEALRAAQQALSVSVTSARKRLGETRKAAAHAAECAIAHPASDPGAILGRFTCSTVTQSLIDRALAEGRSDAAIRQIADEAVRARLNSARKEKRSKQEVITAQIEREAAAAWPQ